MYKSLKLDIYYSTTYDDLCDNYHDSWDSFHNGNYTYAALHANSDQQLPGTSYILMGDVESRLEDLSKFESLGAEAHSAKSFGD